MPDLAQLLKIISQQNVMPQGPVPPGQPPLGAVDPKFGALDQQPDPLGSGYFPGKYQSAGNLPVEGEPYTGSMMQLGMEPQQVEVGSYSPFPGGPAVPLTETQMRVGGEIDPAVRMRLEEWSKLSPAQQEANALQVRRRPGLEEGATAPAPAPAAEEVPRQPGDMNRMRARQELDWLRSMQDIGEGFGRMQVVTTGDVLHKTAKGRGLDTGYKPEGSEIAAKQKQLGDIELEDRKQAGRMAIEKERTKAAETAAGRPRTLPEGSLKAIDGFKRFASQAKKLEEMAGKLAGSLGPIDARLDSVAASLGWQSADVAEFRRATTDMLNRYIRDMTGAQLSKEEATRLTQALPKLTDTQTVYLRKLREVTKEIKKEHDEWIETRRQAGYDVGSFEPLQSQGGSSGGRTIYDKASGTHREFRGSPDVWERLKREGSERFVPIEHGTSGIF